MKKNLLTVLLAAALVLSLAACGQTPAPAGSPADVPAPAAEDGQNPVMNFIGVYSTDSSEEALVEAEGMENAKITVTNAASPWFHTQTVMSGRFDPETLTVEFSNAAMREYTYNSDGSVRQETLSYADGTGRAVFRLADNTLTLTQGLEPDAWETVYRWGASPNMKTVTDPDWYAGVTAMDKYEIEAVVAFNVRSAYLSENWFALADMIRYPITINGTALADADAFLGYMMDKTVSDSDREAMLAEDLQDMFVNYQGIMLGESGQVWLSDPHAGTAAEPVLEIIGLNGIVSRDGSLDAPAAEPESARQDGERFETVIILEGMEEAVSYEHVRSDALGFEMDYDYENFVRRSEGERECFVSDWDDPAQPENYLEVTRSADDAETAAAAIGAALSQEYAISRDDAFPLPRAGRCIRIDASADLSGQTMPDRLQMVYIIPAEDGCRIAAAHYSIEGAEGFGRRFHCMMETFAVA